MSRRLRARRFQESTRHGRTGKPIRQHSVNTSRTIENIPWMRTSKLIYTTDGNFEGNERQSEVVIHTFAVHCRATQDSPPPAAHSSDRTSTDSYAIEPTTESLSPLTCPLLPLTHCFTSIAPASILVVRCSMRAEYLVRYSVHPRRGWLFTWRVGALVMNMGGSKALGHRELCELGSFVDKGCFG